MEETYQGMWNALHDGRLLFGSHSRKPYSRKCVKHRVIFSCEMIYVFGAILPNFLLFLFDFHMKHDLHVEDSLRERLPSFTRTMAVYIA